MLKRIFRRIIALLANKKRYKTSEKQRRGASEANKGRTPWNKGKAGMGIYSEEALAKMLKGTLKSNAKRRQTRRFRKAIKKAIERGIKKFRKLKIKLTKPMVKPLIRLRRRYRRYKQKRERINERKRRLIERHVYQDKKWLKDKYLKAKLSAVEIAQLCSVSREAVCKALRKYGIERRSLVEAWKLRRTKDININQKEII